MTFSAQKKTEKLVILEKKMHPKYAQNSLDYLITRNRCQEILRSHFKNRGEDVCPPHAQSGLIFLEIIIL